MCARAPAIGNIAAADLIFMHRRWPQQVAGALAGRLEGVPSNSASHSATDAGDYIDFDGVILGQLPLLVVHLLSYLDGSLLARQRTQPRLAKCRQRATAEFIPNLQLTDVLSHFISKRT